MTKIIRFKGLCCANCALKLERKINKIKGVDAQINFVAGKMAIEYENDDLYNEVIELCKKQEPEMEFVE
jgi:Cd2+/Zn2+-exporting ATPase